ncbi:hypothetical protein RclHR1_15280003 [Rhizophagus clarus]|uniref:Uncharacterized protein n=1 Tax=Rhizophagus clarus TaxID=94130 RepID=A0A2Z6QS79_9GLOM|nr:hypothetical protein RclHR1_15280003 [Rhizophagus clarus]GES82904.1 hypothetical protein GLOIN_2v1791351 [Rhizophagus clarus]
MKAIEFTKHRPHESAYSSTDYNDSSDEGKKILDDTFQPVLTKNQKKKLRKKAKKQQHKQLPIPQTSTSKQKQPQTQDEVKHIYIQALLHSFETQVLSILKENFQGVTFQDVNEQDKWLIRIFGPDAESVQYKSLAQETNIPNTLISLIVHTALRVYSSVLTSQDSFAEIFSLLEKKTIFKSVSADQQSLQNLPVSPDAMLIFPDADTVLPLPSNGTQDAKPNKSKKAASKSIEKVYINQIILDDKMNNVRDILYDVPAGWSHAKIIAKLKAWGDVISMMTKRQHKYQTLRIKICFLTFSLASFD